MSDHKFILDVPLEDLFDILSDKGWNVTTVTKKLGSSQENRADTNILKYAQETKSVVITIDKPFVSRLKAAGVDVITLGLEDRVKIISAKIEQKYR